MKKINVNLPKTITMKNFFYQLLFIGVMILATQSTQAQQRPDKMPVYPGCEQAEKNMSCMRESILNFIGKNFNSDLLHDIKDTQQVSVLVSFVIDEYGEIDEIIIDSAYAKLNAEMKRVIKLLPKIKPAEANNIPIAMKYQIPVVFEIK